MRGFSALEILISVFIVAAIAAVVFGAMNRFRDARELDSAAGEIENALRRARSLTLASEEGSQFGVYFEASRAVLFAGSSFTEGDPKNEIHNIPARVSVSSVNFSGSLVVFERLTGRASPAGNVVVSLKNDPSRLRTIYADTGGLIYVE